jgi:hypothetical protein
MWGTLMMTMQQKSLQHVMADSTVDTTMTLVATMVGLNRDTVLKIVESGLPVMANVADTDPWIFKALFAQSRKPLPPPTPAYYTQLGKDVTARQALVADFEIIYGGMTDTINRDTASRAGTTEEQASQVLTASMPALIRALGKANAQANEMGFGRQLRQLNA